MFIKSSLFNDRNNMIITPVGGLAIKMINKTGAASVKGDVVHASSTTNNGVSLIVKDIPDPFGVIWSDGVPDGGYIYVVIAGIAEVNFIGDTTRGYLARGFLTADAGYISGKALAEAVPSSPFATDKHFYEIGHVIESRTGAGLAKIIMHFN